MAKSPDRKTAQVITLAVVLLVCTAGFYFWSFQGPKGAGQENSRQVLQCAAATPANPSKHAGMVWIPPGSFTFGDSVYPEEQPAVSTRVTGFWMDATEVTNAQFAEFVQATGYITTAERAVDSKLYPHLPPDMQLPGAVVFISPTDLRHGGDPRQWWQYRPGAQWRHPGGPGTNIDGKGALPVVAVTFADAQAYAAWKGRHLPTEVQWEWAAWGGKIPEQGNTVQPTQANTWQGLFPLSNQTADGFAGLAPTACFQPNGYGLYDMIGNVWEFTADRYTESHRPQDNLPPDQPPLAQRPGASPQRHVIKGGSHLCAPNYCMRYRPGARQPQEDDLATSHIGFRTILLANGP